MSDPLGQSQVIPYLKGLSAKGHEITILSCEKRDRFETQKDELVELFRNNNIKWSHCFYKRSTPVFAPMRNVSRLKKLAKDVTANNSYDIVHCRSYLAALIGLGLKSKYGMKFIFDMRGFWVDERAEGGIWNIKNPLYRYIYKYFKRKEKSFLLEADHIISLTHKAAETMQQWPFLQAKNPAMTVIPCCVDLRHFNGADIFRAKTRAELGFTEDDIILSYIGSVGTWYLLDEMLNFYKRMLKKFSSKFLFITPETENIIFDAAKRLGVDIENIIVKSSTYDKMPEMISVSDLSILFIKPVFSKTASSPTKLGEILGMGVPIIYNANIGDSDMQFDGVPFCIKVEAFSETDYDSAVNKIDAVLDSSQQEVINLAAKYFSLDQGIESYNKVYEGLMKLNTTTT